MKRVALGVLLTIGLVAVQAGCQHSRCYRCCPPKSVQPELAVQRVDVTDSGTPPIVRLAEPPRSLLVR